MSQDKEVEVPFEKALERLESLVISMEEGEVPLADLVEKFEEGSKLIDMCQSRLDAAELKISTLRQSKDGLIREGFELDPSDS